MNEILLYDFWRSSASYRVRIVLNLKGVLYTAVPTSLLDGDHKNPDYVARNPQGFVPMLSIDGHDLTQSLAIIDYLDANEDAGAGVVDCGGYPPDQQFARAEISERHDGAGSDGCR
jgi:glutathione S-transferase